MTPPISTYLSAPSSPRVGMPKPLIGITRKNITTIAMGEKTRATILMAIAKPGTTTAIAKRTKLQIANIRHHIEVLHKMGLAKIVGMDGNARIWAWYRGEAE